MSKIKNGFSKNILNLFKTSGITFAIFFVLIIIYLFFWTPGEKKARRLVVSIFHYLPPASAKLIYSKNYWASFDNLEPRSICLGFQYSEQDFIDFNNIDFSASNHNDTYYSSYPVKKNKGCAQLIARQNFIKKHFSYFQYLEGGTIFIDMKNQIVIFEIYFFD